MGEVYRAKDPRLGREVAIKVLPASFSQDADRLRRFEQEAKAAGVLNHPNITAVYDIGQHDGAPYVVQELLEGETLRAELAGGRFSPRKAIEYATQIAHGLAAAHEKGIVHRDLKPENVFVTKDGRVKILDFGLAKLTRRRRGSGPQTNLPTATAGTEPGVVLGTLGYMSPEQVRGKPADARSDIFSFGAILYEMLSGKRAFHGDSAGETRWRRSSRRIRRISRSPTRTSRRGSSASSATASRRIRSDASSRRTTWRSTSGRSRALRATVAAAAAPVLRSRAAPHAGARRRGRDDSGCRGVLGRPARVPRWKPRRPPRSCYSRLTFRRGNVLLRPLRAGRPDRRLQRRLGATAGRDLTRARGGPGVAAARRSRTPDLLSVSSSGELAILLHENATCAGPVGTGTLARVPLGGGARGRSSETSTRATGRRTASSSRSLRGLEGSTALEYPARQDALSHPGRPSSAARLAGRREGRSRSTRSRDAGCDRDDRPRRKARRTLSQDWIAWPASPGTRRARRSGWPVSTTSRAAGHGHLTRSTSPAAARHRAARPTSKSCTTSPATAACSWSARSACARSIYGSSGEKARAQPVLARPVRPSPASPSDGEDAAHRRRRGRRRPERLRYLRPTDGSARGQARRRRSPRPLTRRQVGPDDSRTGRTPSWSCFRRGPGAPRPRVEGPSGRTAASFLLPDGKTILFSASEPGKGSPRCTSGPVAGASRERSHPRS